MMMRWCFFALLATVASAFQPNSFESPSQPPKFFSSSGPVQDVARTAAAAALSALLVMGGAPLPVSASDTAAQITLNSVPPSSISIQIEDLPVVGKLISGTYTKVPDGSVKQPSIVIKSPSDKVKAISKIATGGHLEFDVNGKLLSTHLDVDVAADEPGVAKVVVASNLIPKLPFKNLASDKIGGPTGGKESPWSIVTNLGNGESYYYNVKTGVTQTARPDQI